MYYISKRLTNNRIIIPLFFFFLFPFVSCSKDDYLPEEQILEVDTQTSDTTIAEKYDTVIVEKKDTVITERNDTVITGTNDTVIIVKYDTIISQSLQKDTFLCSYEKYMGITIKYGNGQGAACFGKYFFQGYSNNAAIGIYDLENKHPLCKLDIFSPPSSSKIHANTVCFGNERLSSDDYFPLLYISSGYTQTIGGIACSFIYVYRIGKFNNSDGTEGFNIELVQTITLKDFGVWTEGIPDNDNYRLWIKYEPSFTPDEYRYASFKMPKLEEGDVILTKDNVIDEFSLGVQPFISSNQGHLYHDNKILLVSGTSPKSQKLAYIEINTITKTRELVIDLAELGLTDEPENLFYYKNQLMIGYRGAIYKFNVRKLSKDF